MSVFKIAQESIDFQKKDNFFQMAVYAKAIFAYKSGAEAQKSQELKDLIAFLRKVTKMKIDINMLFDDTGVASVRVEHINKNNPLADDFRRLVLEQDQDKFTQKIKGKLAEGAVNIENASVEGIYTLVPVKINWSFRHISFANISPEEAVALLLHEIGHVFNYFVCMSMLVRQNLVLAAALKANSDKPDEKIYRHRIEVVAHAAGYSDEVTQALGGVRKAEAVQAVLLTEDFKELRSAKGLDNYDQVYSEAMADHFAMRYGAGAHLAGALDKAKRASIFYSNGFFIYLQLAELFGLFISIGLGIAAPFLPMAGGLFFGGFLIVINTLSVFLHGDSMRDFEYDDLKIRYQRMRNQAVEYIKSPALSSEDKAAGLQAIESIDKIMDRAIEFKSPLRAISNFVFSSNANVKRAIELEHEIEEFTSNQLFVNATKLALHK